MTDHDLPPHLRETNRQIPAFELPLEQPLEPPPPPQPRPTEDADERPVDPFLRRS